MAIVGVTGATGFVGGRLVPALAATGFDLRLVDDRSGPVLAEHANWPAERIDFASAPALNLLSDCDLIVHLAAISGVVACAREPEAASRVNVDGTRRLYAMCRDRHIPVVFASSLAVVGAPESLPVRETTGARPTHEYARQKARGEELTRELSRAEEVPGLNLRMSNIYGGYEIDGILVTKPNVLELFARQAMDGSLKVNAPGTQRRDFVHVDDVVAHWVAAVRFGLRHQHEAESPTLNVASGEALSVLELANRVAQVFSGQHPRVPPLRIEVVVNPRAAIELVEPEFAVDRSITERTLDVTVRHHLVDEIPIVLGRAEKATQSRHLPSA